MSDSKTNEELPKKELAQKVITPKRRYFFPEHGKSVEADDYADAVQKMKDINQEKVGD